MSKMKRMHFPAEKYETPARKVIEGISRELELAGMYETLPAVVKEHLPEADLGSGFLRFAKDIGKERAGVIEVSEYRSGGRGDGMMGVSPARWHTYPMEESGIEILSTELRSKVDTLGKRVRTIPKSLADMTEEHFALAEEIRTLAGDYLTRIAYVAEFARGPIC